MKIAVITDMHFGARNDMTEMLDHQEMFFRDVFFPKIDELGIDTILDLGDVYDKRKSINFLTLKRSKEMYWDPIAERKIEYHGILGNHDTHFKNTNEVNSRRLLLSEYDNIHIYEDDPKELTLGSTKFLLIPWITKENSGRLFEAIKDTSAHVVGGHFDIKGFEMQKGRVSKTGIEKSFFDGCQEVWSGHFHRPSGNGNIRYLGSPYEMTWIDYGESKGFHIYDTETGELEKVKNPSSMFNVVEFESGEDVDKDYSHLTGTFVRVKANGGQSSSQREVEDFVKRIESFNPVEVKVTESSLSETLHLAEGEDVDPESVKDTGEIISEYVDSLETKVEKKHLKDMMETLYFEASKLEE